ncbi:hypothetical protein BXT92_12200 [Klebsiella pneumoniae]|nr:hypothetical protein BXT92_12200 [Klebsiella pneumoniae]
MTANIPVITIDGPGGAGKGTLCKAMAEALGWHLLDSGAIYRVLALAALQIKERDDRDRNRAVAPLVPAADALVLDSTELNIEQVIEKALQYAREKLAVA